MMSYIRTFVLTFVLASCSLDGIVSVDDPEGGARELDNKSVRSKSGAIGMYHSSIASLKKAVSVISKDIALFTDEVQVMPYLYFGDDGRPNSDELLDSRTTRGGADILGNTAIRFSSDFYTHINSARIHASQARQLFMQYGDSSTQSLVANAYSIEAYAILLLAENGCSGIPLTDIPFEGSVEYTEGYTTQELFAKSVSLFDSSLSILHDSLHFYTLARVGAGRANLGLGNFEDAALSVVDVEESSPSFTLSYSEAFTPGSNFQDNRFWTTTSASLEPVVAFQYVENGEGINGMEWLSPPGEVQDPRVPIGLSSSPAVPQQRKFVGGNPEFVLASWIDAQMIRAEATLNRNGLAGIEWLEPVNDARRSIGLSDTSGLESPMARVDLLFRERAFWFYLTGTRLGDLRRQVRQYDKLIQDVFPVGEYTKSDPNSTGRILFYGDYFVFAPPLAEVEYNYKYFGCDHLNP